MFFHKLSRWKWKTIARTKSSVGARRKIKLGISACFCVWKLGWSVFALPRLFFSPIEVPSNWAECESQLMSKRNENLMLSREGWSIHLAMGNFVVRYSLFPFVPLRFCFAQTKSEWKAFFTTLYKVMSVLFLFSFPFPLLRSTFYASRRKNILGSLFCFS